MDGDVLTHIDGGLTHIDGVLTHIDGAISSSQCCVCVFTVPCKFLQLVQIGRGSVRRIVGVLHDTEKVQSGRALDGLSLLSLQVG